MTTVLIFIEGFIVGMIIMSIGRPIVQRIRRWRNDRWIDQRIAEYYDPNRKDVFEQERENGYTPLEDDNVS